MDFTLVKIFGKKHQKISNLKVLSVFLGNIWLIQQQGLISSLSKNNSIISKIGLNNLRSFYGKKEIVRFLFKKWFSRKFFIHTTILFNMNIIVFSALCKYFLSQLARLCMVIFKAIKLILFISGEEQN